MADQLPAGEDLGRLPTDKELARLQRTTVLYYLHETNPDNGLVRDKTDPDAPCSIAAVGLALATIPVVVERGVIIRKFAAKIARRRLRSLMDSRRGPSRTPPATRDSSITSSTWRPAAASGTASCRPSTRRSCSPVRSRAPPTSTRDTEDEAEIRRLADALYRRADWDWALQRRPDAHPRLEAGDRLPAAPLGGLRRGAAALPARPRLADSPTAAGELRRLLRHLPVEGDLRPRAALLRAAVHPPALAPVDRFPRHPRRVHARARQRLLREQPAGDLRAAGVRDPQPAGVRGLRRVLLGVHGLRRPGLGQARRWTGSSGSSTTTSPAALRSARTTARSLRGSWSPRCRSPRRSSSRPSATSPGWTWG